jgi:hypothetical protein
VVVVLVPAWHEKNIFFKLITIYFLIGIHEKKNLVKYVLKIRTGVINKNYSLHTVRY